MKSIKNIGKIFAMGMIIFSPLAAVSLDMNTHSKLEDRYAIEGYKGTSNFTTYCPTYYQPVQCKVEYKGDYFVINASNKCFAMVKIREFLRNRGIEFKDVVAECKPVSRGGWEKFPGKEKERGKSPGIEERYVGKYYDYGDYREKTINITKRIISLKAKMKQVSNEEERERIRKEIRELEEKLGKMKIELVKKYGANPKFSDRNNIKEIAIKRIKEMTQKKEEIINKIENREKEIKNKIKVIKSKAIKEIKEQKKLKPETKKEIFEIIKEKLLIKLDKLEVKLTEYYNNYSNNDKTLIKILNVLNEEGEDTGNASVSVETTEYVEAVKELIAKIGIIKEDLKEAQTVPDLLLIINQYLEIKKEVNKLSVNVVSSVNTNNEN